MQLIQKYFPELTTDQQKKFERLESLVREWNQKINLISRKDIQFLVERHFLHSLAIAKCNQFQPGQSVLDVGTGGGFPGIPLAILFPETKFHLIDSIGKKIMVVRNLTGELELNNVSSDQIRVENLNRTFEFIVARAVTALPEFIRLVKGKCRVQQNRKSGNGLYYLKGGDLSEELNSFKEAQVFPLYQYFEEPYFTSKLVVHLPGEYLQ
jgi:16S rRNA (guanine527-N7)-methyltransferase